MSRRRNSTAMKSMREDTSLASQAISQMWPLSAEQREMLVAAQLNLVCNPITPQIIQVMAAKNLVAMGIHNLRVLEVLRAAMSVETQSSYEASEPVDRAELAQGLIEFAASAEQRPDVVVAEQPRETLPSAWREAQ